jgi:hypothetical protein
VSENGPETRDPARSFATIFGHLVVQTGRVAGPEIRRSAMENWSADTTARLGKD